MSALTASSFATPPVAAFRDVDRMMLKAMRLWVVFARSGRNPRACLAGQLGESMAARFSLLMDRIVTCWPDPFTTYPPCACMCSPDEALVMALLGHAEANRQDAADRLLAEMLPDADRGRLWAAALRCVLEQLGTH